MTLRGVVDRLRYTMRAQTVVKASHVDGLCITASIWICSVAGVEREVNAMLCVQRRNFTILVLTRIFVRVGGNAAEGVCPNEIRRIYSCWTIIDTMVRTNKTISIAIFTELILYLLNCMFLKS